MVEKLAVCKNQDWRSQSCQEKLKNGEKVNLQIL